MLILPKKATQETVDGEQRMWLRRAEREIWWCVGKRRRQCFVLPKPAAVVKCLVARPECLLPPPRGRDTHGHAELKERNILTHIDV